MIYTTNYEEIFKYSQNNNHKSLMFVFFISYVKKLTLFEIDLCYKTCSTRQQILQLLEVHS